MIDVRKYQSSGLKIALVLGLAFSLGLGSAAAQSADRSGPPRTGDAWVDSQLEDVNRYGARYRAPFVDEMVRYYGAPRDLVNDLLAEKRWPPGDVYYACAIAQIVGRPCRYVVDRWQRDQGLGWGEVATSLGIAPGSPEFHRLKRGFVQTYDRWARPIQIDPQLHDDFPGRAKGSPAQRANNSARVEPGARAPRKGEGKGRD